MHGGVCLKQNSVSVMNGSDLVLYISVSAALLSDSLTWKSMFWAANGLQKML